MPSGGGIHAINRAAARHKGVPLVEVSAEFGVNLRTGQRMIRGLEAAFPSVEFSTDQDRWRWWKLSDTRTLGMQGIRDGELEALEMSIRRAQREGAIRHVGWRCCMRCQRSFWSDDVVRSRICAPCKTRIEKEHPSTCPMHSEGPG